MTCPQDMTWVSVLGLPLGLAILMLAIQLGTAVCIWAENQKPRDINPPEKRP